MDNLYQEESSDQDKPLPHQSGKPGRKFFLSLAVIIIAGSVWFVGHGNTGFFTGGVTMSVPSKGRPASTPSIR